MRHGEAALCTPRCEGSLFILYTDENHKKGVSGEKLHTEFKHKMLQCHQRILGTGKVGHPIPSKSSPGDCNFVVATPVQQEEEHLEEYEILAERLEEQDQAGCCWIAITYSEPE